MEHARAPRHFFGKGRISESAPACFLDTSVDQCTVAETGIMRIRKTRADYTRVAVELFVQKGVHRVEDKDITAALEVRPSALAKHFPLSKELDDRRSAILFAALKYCWVQLGSLIQNGLSYLDENASARDRLAGIVKACISAFRARNTENRNALLFLAMYYRDPSVDYQSSHLAEFFGLVDSLISGAQPRHGVSAVAVREALIGAMLEMLYSWTTMRDGRSKSKKSTGAEPYSLKDIEGVMTALLDAFLLPPGEAR